MRYRPALVVLSPYLFGILVARRVGYVPVFWLWLPGLLLLLAGLTVNSQKRPNLFHSLLLLSICCCGWLRFSIHITPTFPDYLFEQQVFFQGTVDYDPAAERPSTSYYITGSVQLRVSSDRTKSADPVSKRTRLLVKFR